jgi:cystathionine beta-lyase/cystathionine gamma-synthase
MTAEFKGFETQLIHAGEMRPRIEGAVSMPVFQSSTFEHPDEASPAEDSYYKIKYLRLNNTPNHMVLQEKLATLEKGEAARVTSSGMAAISTTLLTILSSGDHLLVEKCLYGGTHDFITKDFSSFGITFDFIDGEDPDSWKPKLRASTKAIYTEALTNPLMQVVDLEAVVQFAKENRLLAVIDNTFTSPVNFRPLEWGFDLSLHSGTKYLNGHSDIAAGAVIGRQDLIQRIDHRLAHLGGSLNPHACFLLHRGMKTLALRVRYQNQSALQIARFLANHPAVARVNYPGLESHPRHQRACRLFDGFSGMLSFELGAGVEGARRLIRNASLPVVAPSLGGVETLITRPATTSHVAISAAERKELGISDGLIRLSVGLESTEDLIEDLDQAMKA